MGGLTMAIHDRIHPAARKTLPPTHASELSR